MGWALKTTGSRTQFTEGQRKFLTEQFLIGEECGKKTDPQQVWQQMRRVSDDTTVRLFSEKDVLSPSRWQVSSQDGKKIRKTSVTPRTKNVKVKTKSNRVQLRQRPYICTYRQL